MSFLAPWAFLFGLIALPIVALYLLKIKRRKAPVPSVEFWMTVVKETRATSLFRKLKRIFSLLLQILILALLVFALGNPILGSALIKRESVVVILDASASMKTMEGKKTRFELAGEKVRELVRSKGYEDDVMLVLAAGRPEVACPFMGSADAVIEALEKTAPRNCEANLAAAHELACAMLSGKENPLVFVVSDGSSGDVAAMLDKNGYTSYIKVGRVSENVGITAFEARKNRSLMTDYVFTRVRNYSSKKKEIALEIWKDEGGGEELWTAEKIELAPGEEVARTFRPLALEGGARVRMKLITGDPYPLDDEAFTLIRPTRSMKVVLVTTDAEGKFFQAALNAMGALVANESLIVTPGEYENLDAAGRNADVTILNSSPVSVEKVPGDVIAFHTGGAGLPLEKLGEKKNPAVSEWKREHPIMRYITFTRVFLEKAEEVRLLGEAEVLLESDEGPLMLLFEGDRKILYAGFDVMDTDMPFRIAFPSLLRNILHAFEESDYGLLKSSYATGERVIPTRRLENASEVSVARIDSTGEEKDWSVPVSAGTFIFEDTELPGSYRFTIGEKNYFASVNVPPGEGDVAPVEIEREGKTISFSILGRAFWLYFAAAAAIFFMLEWLLFTRRITE